MDLINSSLCPNLLLPHLLSCSSPPPLPEQDEELQPSLTEGYKVGQQKTVEELAELDKVSRAMKRGRSKSTMVGSLC